MMVHSEDFACSICDDDRETPPCPFCLHREHRHDVCEQDMGEFGECQCADYRKHEADTMSDRIDKLRIAIDAAVDDLNLIWRDSLGDQDLLREVITALQHARTSDDIANGRDWYPPAAPEKPTPLADAEVARIDRGWRDDLGEYRRSDGAQRNREADDDARSRWGRAALEEPTP